MSYEYKDKIKEDLEYSLEAVSIDYYSSEELLYKQKVKELDYVYAQATKADEYEAKAKAWDRVYKAFEKAENEHEFSNGVCTVMNEYESGELNER